MRHKKRRRRSSLHPIWYVYRMHNLSGAQMHAANERPRCPNWDEIDRKWDEIEGKTLNPVLDYREEYGADDDEFDYWVDHCGYVPSEQACTKAGSEECDFECPFAWNRRQAQATVE